MRRASEGVHASLVQQRKETKRVTDKVRLLICNCSICFSIFLMFACLLQLSHSVEMGELKKDLAVARVKVVACYHFVTFLPLILFFF